MIIGKVIGEIVSTINHPFYDGRKLLVVDKTDASGKPSGDYIIAIDGGVMAGAGDQVLVIDEGNCARQIVNDPDAPLRSIIVGIVDRVDLV